jgi:hypothetical protein
MHYILFAAAALVAVATGLLAYSFWGQLSPCPQGAICDPGNSTVGHDRGFVTLAIGGVVFLVILVWAIVLQATSED